MTSTRTDAKTIAQAVGIAPRTKRFTALDSEGYPVFFTGEAERWEHVVSAVRMARTDRGVVTMRVYLIAVALHKAMTTGRMNVNLARRVREQYSPYQVCALIAKTDALYEGEPTIGELADFWFNQHADRL